MYFLNFNMASEYESVLCVKNQVFVFKIPPRQSNRGYRAADWKLDEPDWTGRLRVVAKGKQLSIKLEDKNSGELFAECPVDIYPGVAVESVLDSSRYFVIRIKDEGGRSAFIGIGFGDRGESFDLNVALQDHFKWLKQEEEAQKTMADPQNGPKLDLGFKEGQTITLNIGTKKSSDSPSRSRTRPHVGGAGGIGLLPPPPGGLKISPPPTASNVQSEVVPQPSDVKNENSGASSGVDLLQDVMQTDNVASTQQGQNPPDLWGDFTGASSAAASSDHNTNSSNWVQF